MHEYHMEFHWKFAAVVMISVKFDSETTSA